MMRGSRPSGLSPLGLVLSVAVLTRFWGLGFGLPDFFFYIDEDNVVRPALKILATLDPNPHNFIYPSLYIYVQSIVFALYYVVRGLPLGYPGIENIPIWEFYLLGRTVSAVLAVATIYLVYKVGEELFDSRAGLLSAAVMTGVFVHAVNSHYAKNDIPAVLLGLSAFLCSLWILRGGGRRSIILAGLTTGLATATSYNAFLFIIPPLTAYFLSNYRRGFASLAPGLPLLLLPALGGFILGCPYCLLSPSEFAASPWFQRTLALKGLTPADILVHMSPMDGTPSWLWYIKYLWSSGLYYPVALASLGGLALLLRPKRENIFLLSFPVFYAISLLLMGEVYRTDRLTLPLVPFFALYSGYFLSRALSITSRPKAERTRALLAVLLIAFFIALPIGRILLFDLSIAGPDTRELAEAWMLENLSRDTLVFMWGGSPMLIGHHLRAKGYPNIINTFRVDERLFDLPGALVVVGESEYQTAKNYRNTEKYGREYGKYKYLFDNAIILKEFANNMYKKEFFSSFGLEHSSTVNNYHNPAIKIFEIPEEGANAFRVKVLTVDDVGKNTDMERVTDPASGEKVLYSQRSKRVSVDGPYFPIPMGNYEVVYRLKTSSNSKKESIINLNIRTLDGRILAERSIKGTGFYAPHRYLDFTLSFNISKPAFMAIRLATYGEEDIWLDRIVIKRGASSTRIIGISDIHIGARSNSSRPIIEHIPSWNPDLVIYTGDVVADGSNPSDWDLFEQVAFDPLRDAGIPQLFVCGNHDEPPSWGRWINLPWAYPFKDGLPYYAYDVGNVHLTVICNSFANYWYNTTGIEPRSDAQMAWIDSDLASSISRPWRVLAAHKGGYADPGRKWMFNISDDDYRFNQRKQDEWLEKYPGLIFFAGHQHKYESYVHNGTLYHHLPASNTIVLHQKPHIEGEFVVYDFNATALRIRVVDWTNATISDFVYEKG